MIGTCYMGVQAESLFKLASSGDYLKNGVGIFVKFKIPRKKVTCGLKLVLVSLRSGSFFVRFASLAAYGSPIPSKTPYSCDCSRVGWF